MKFLKTCAKGVSLSLGFYNQNHCFVNIKRTDKFQSFLNFFSEILPVQGFQLVFLIERSIKSFLRTVNKQCESNTNYVPVVYVIMKFLKTIMMINIFRNSYCRLHKTQLEIHYSLQSFIERSGFVKRVYWWTFLVAKT